MSKIINKQTLEVRDSVHTPDYLDGNWVINPILPACESKYWKIVGDKIVEMTAPEKIVVDTTAQSVSGEAEKESLIIAEIEELGRIAAIASLKVKGELDAVGNIIKK